MRIRTTALVLAGAMAGSASVITCGNGPPSSMGQDSDVVVALTKRVTDLEAALAAIPGKYIANGDTPQNASFSISGSGNVGKDFTVGGTLVRQGPQASISINGLYCGKSAQTTTGSFQFNNLVGYRAAKAACESACGSPHAHMCTASEISYSFQVGALGTFASEALWYSSLVRVEYSGSSYDDCDGWQCGQAGRQACSTSQGAQLGNQSRVVNTSICNQAYRISCCL